MNPPPALAPPKLDLDLLGSSWTGVVRVVGSRLWRFQASPYLDSRSKNHNSPKPFKTAQKAILLHTFRVQLNPKP